MNGEATEIVQRINEHIDMRFDRLDNKVVKVHERIDNVCKQVTVNATDISWLKKWFWKIIAVIGIGGGVGGGMIGYFGG